MLMIGMNSRTASERSESAEEVYGKGEKLTSEDEGPESTSLEDSHQAERESSENGTSVDGRTKSADSNGQSSFALRYSA